MTVVWCDTCQTVNPIKRNKRYTHLFCNFFFQGCPLGFPALLIRVQLSKSCLSLSHIGIQIRNTLFKLRNCIIPL